MTTDNADVQVADPFFPPAPRVIYQHSPLIEVVCQLRFPRLLKIEASPPADFQERIRGMFPLFSRPNLMPSLPPPVAQLLGQQVGIAPYQFSTSDNGTTVSLTSDAIQVTTSAYEQWEGFRERFRLPLRALAEIYKPSFFSGIGLCYVDAIECKASLGLGGKKWSELLRREVLGELAVPAFEDYLEESQRMIRVRFPDGSGSVQLRHGLAQIQGHQGNCYVLNFDFSKQEKTEVQHADNVLDTFHRRAGRAFRWSITDELHRALGPTPIAEVGG